MCFGVGETSTALIVTGIVIAAASAAAGIYAQQQQANAQADMQRKMQQAREKEIAENYKLATESADLQQKQLQARAVQEGEKASQEQQAVSLDAARARATARTAAGESGVAGLSLDALLSDFTRSEAMYRDTSNRNLQGVREQLGYEAEGVRATSRGQINAIRPFLPEPINRPNFLGASLRIAQTGLNAYGTYRSAYPATT
jgi:hypothetical protein